MPMRVVLASAGSGKTESLAEYALAALEEARKPSDFAQPGVLAITFTRNAAAELRERILKKADQKQKKDLLRQIILGQAPLFTSTIDAFTREIYYHLAPLLALPAYTSLIVDTQDAVEAVYTLVEAMLEQLSQPALLRLLRRKLHARLQQEGRRILPAQLLQEALEVQLSEGPLRSRIRLALYEWLFRAPSELPWQEALTLQRSDADLATWVYKSMQAYRESARKLFLSDVQAVVQLAARKVPFLLSERAYFYTHLFVDEAQDTSPAQWELLQPFFEELRSRGGHITLIGDPKQSIYAWRDADFRQLLQYAAQAAEKIVLDTNYRSHEALVEFNNQLYSQLPQLLSHAVANSNSKKPYKNLRQKAVEELRKLYNKESVWQKANRSSKGTSEYVQIIYPEFEEEDHLREVLIAILDELKRKGIPPQETAFLVRANEDIQKLFRILPDYPLQVQFVYLETCTTLVATMALLELLPATGTSAQPRSVEEYFLQRQANSEALLEALLELRRAFTDYPASSLKKLDVFQRIGALWLKDYPEHAPFWNLFLSELYTLLAKHPFYGIGEVLRWWHSRARKAALNLPPSEGVYPVLTIHKAKGLAWDAVILPFVDWELLLPRAEGVKWRRVPKAIVPPSLAQILQSVEDLAFPDAWELPMKITRDATEFASLYEEAYTTGVVESVNLHYVATTRPREYLFLIPKAPASLSRNQKGANTWAGFWAQLFDELSEAVC